MESNVFSQSCRICSSELEHEHGVLFFSDEGKRLYLQAKIRKYLYITVSMDDKLPKIICNNCCTKLEGIHRFATMAVRNQDKLNKLMTDSTNCSTTDNKKMENKGLLHTYLTKGIIDKQSEDTEEMEVKVDPMLFFEYNSDQSEDNEYNDNENVSDVILETPDSTKIKSHEIQDDEKRKNFDCSICSKTFNSEFALQNHVWCHIPKNKRVVLNNHNNFYLKYSSSKKCENNGNDMREEVNSDSEEKSQDDNGDAIDNSNNMRYACPICGKIISTKGNLKVHLETHRPKGKYGCDICGRIFKTQCNLHRHKEYHTGVQFTCGVCGRVYPTNSTLRAHSITHSDLRPHKCPLCDKTFKRNQDLKFHINQHTGARPYQCPYCPKAFASSGNCFSHRKRMHPLEVERDRERAAKIMR